MLRAIVPDEELELLAPTEAATVVADSLPFDLSNRARREYTDGFAANDCVDPDPIQAWSHWKNNFMRFDQRWQHHLPVFRKLEREENCSFLKNGVLFVGLNIVGGRIQDTAEWRQRHGECLNWVRMNLSRFGDEVSSVVVFGHAMPAAMHADFFDPFNDDAQKFSKPILYLHGDRPSDGAVCV